MRIGSLHPTLVALSLLVPACAGHSSPARSSAAAAPVPVNPFAQPPLAIAHVTVIDGTGAPPQADRTVVVANGRIAAIGAGDSVSIPPGTNRIDARGKYLIPGLWDAHTHVGFAGACSLPLLLANGITSVRDMGGEPVEVREWKRAIEARTQVGPHIRTAGPILEDQRWLEAVLKEVQEEHDTAGVRDMLQRLAVAGPEDAARAVDSAARLGADFIKVRTVASRESFLAILAAAHRHGLLVAAHAPEMDLTRVIAPGLGSIEHTETLALALAAAPAHPVTEVGTALAKAGVWYTPTLLTAFNWRILPDSAALALIADSTGARDPRNRYVTAAMRESWRIQIESKKNEAPRDWAALVAKDFDNLKALKAAGVGILAGTDLGAPLAYPGFGLHDELALLVERGGLTPLEALQAATRNPAVFFGIQAEVGTVEMGRRADLVVLEADPLADIRNTRRIGAVVFEGRWMDREELNRLLKRAGAVASARPEVGAGKGVPAGGVGC